MQNINAILAKPLNEHRLWAIWIWNRSITEPELEQQLCSIAEAGFGGVAIRPGRDMNPSYMSEDFFRLFGLALQLCKDKGLQVRIADDFSAPWCDLFQNVCSRARNMRLTKLSLEFTEIVPAKGAFERDIADPASALVLAALVKDSAVDLSSTKVIALQPGKNHLTWKPPTADEWRVMILRKEQAKNSSGLYLPNLYSPKTAEAYIKSYLEPLRKNFLRFIPGTLEGFINEMPGVFPDDKGIPWDDNMIVRYRSKYKKDLVKLLPCLFFEPSSGDLRNRPHILSFLAQAIYDNFAEPLEKWGVKNRLYQWLLCAEQEPLSWRSALNSFYSMPAGKHKYVGWQNIEGTFKSFPLLYAASAMNALEFKRHTLVVIGRNRSCAASSIQSLKNEIEQNLALGDCTLILDGLFFNLDHRTHVKTPFNPFWYSPEWRFMPLLCTYAARLRGFAQDVQAERDIAVLFPAVPVQGEYTPGNADVVSRVWGRLDKLVDELRRLNVSFDVISEEMLISCSIKPTGHFGAADKTRPANYRALVLPYSRFISKSLFVFLEKLEAKGGTIIFIDDTPQGSLDEGITAGFSQRVEKLLRSRHGKAVVLASTGLARLREWVEPAVAVNAQGKDCHDIIVTPWIGKGYSILFTWNSSDTNEWHASLDLPLARHLYAIDCASENLQELTAVEYSEKKVRCSLAYRPLESRLLFASNTKYAAVSRKPEKKAGAGAFAKGARNYRVVLRNQWKLVPRSLNVLPLSSWSIRIGLSKEFGGYSHYCETYFEVKEIPPLCCLLLNEFSGVAGGDPGVDKSFDLTVNGTRIERFWRGLPPHAPDGAESPLKTALAAMGYVRGSLVCDLRDTIAKGYNRIALRSVGLVGDPPVILYPPLVVGEFSIERGTKGLMIGNAPPMVSSDSWTRYGFPYLCGEASYAQVFEVPTAYERLVLNFPKVSGPACVSVNGADLGWMYWQPMEIDVTQACTAKRNELTVTILNTVDNVLRLNGRPSGLLGDVFLDVY